MSDYKQRVVEELNDLNEKIDKLSSFILAQDKNLTIDKVDLNLLIEQRFHMSDYRDILELRISRF